MKEAIKAYLDAQGQQPAQEFGGEEFPEDIPYNHLRVDCGGAGGNRHRGGVASRAGKERKEGGMNGFEFWCGKCAETLTERCDEKFGKGNWMFSNLTCFLNLDTEKFVNGLTPLHVSYHPKTKKGEISKKTRQFSFAFSYCPFCGSRIDFGKGGKTKLEEKKC